MDTMKLLLGATIALLIAALAVSWQGMKNGVKNTPPDEIARLQKQINEIKYEQQKHRLEKHAQQSYTAPVQPSAAEVEAMRAQIEASSEALAEAESPAEKAARTKKLARDEEGLLAQRDLESADSELRRARMIAEALLIGKVLEFVESPQGGDFITIEVLMAEQVQIGTIIAVRRKTGILGQLKVADVTPEGAIANPLPGFGPVKPQPGDELILPPQY